MKKVLFVDLAQQEADVKTVADLNKYIGGVGIGLRLLLDNITKDPLVISVGPLNGFFPYASKTSLVCLNSGVVEDFYIGGALSTRLRFTGLDSLVIHGKSSEPMILDIHNEEISFRSADTDIVSLGLPGKKCILKPEKNKFFLDDYFLAPESFLEEKLFSKNVTGIAITGTKNFAIPDKEKYTEIRNKVLSQINELSVDQSSHPSCSGCPMGCNKSRIGEIGGNVLIHSLVACTYAENIYSNIGVAFSCLNVLGYDYTHEDIESLPALIKEVLKELA